MEILAQELSAAIPEKQFEYERLLSAAAEFDRAVGPEWSARLPHIGTLLGCAVADELAGSTLAVESLRSWLTDGGAEASPRPYSP